MLISATVMDWRTDGLRRVHDKTTGQDYLLNHLNMFEIHSHSTGAWMYYADNRYNRRERPAFLKTTSTVAALQTLADVTPYSLVVTLPVFPDNDPTLTAVDTTVNIDDITRAWDFEDGGTLGHSWVACNVGTYDEVLYRVDNTIAEIYDNVSAGTSLP